MSSVRELPLTSELLGDVAERLQQAGDTLSAHLAHQIEMQRALDTGGLELELANANLEAAHARAAGLAPRAGPASGSGSEAEAELRELRPRAARAEAEVKRVAAQLAEARRAAEEGGAVEQGLEARLMTERRRAEEAEGAQRLAEEENVEWRTGSIRVATYKKWRETRDDARRARGEILPPPEQSAENALALIERAVVGGAGAMPLRPPPAELEEQSGSGDATVSTVALSLEGA